MGLNSHYVCILKNYSGSPISLDETLFKTQSLFETAKEDLEDKTEKEINEPFKGRPGQAEYKGTVGILPIGMGTFFE